MKIRQILLGVTTATVALVGMAGPAAAAPFALPEHKCASKENVGNWCLFIEKPNAGVRRYRVQVGIDLTMSRADAQAIIDAPGDPIAVRMYGDDSPGNDYLFGVPQVNISATANGLSANFSTEVSGEALDEDDYIGNRGDEVFATITFRDPRTGLTYKYDSPNINEHF